jgi:ketosteroid isomerase-like protein
MNAKHYLPLAVLFAALVPGSGNAMGQAHDERRQEKDHLKIRQLIDRQAQAWQKHDFSIAAGDWLPTAELVSPGGRLTINQLPAAINDYFKHFRDVHVTVKNVFSSADESKVALEWDWDVTRIRDGIRQVSHDAIIVDLHRGKIASWREYFDLGHSIDAQP